MYLAAQEHSLPSRHPHHLSSPGRSTTTFGRNIDRTEWNTEPTEPIFGRTDLRKGVSEAKFDVEADFDVKKSLAPPKAAENHEKPKKNRKHKFKKNFRRQKIESCKSSEMRFAEVSRRSERSTEPTEPIDSIERSRDRPYRPKAAVRT